MVLKAIAVGIVLSAVMTGLTGWMQPDTPLHLSASPWGDYVALATAPDVSLLVVFGWTASLVAVCLFVAMWRREKRLRRARALAEVAEMENINEEEAEPCSPFSAG